MKMKEVLGRYWIFLVGVILILIISYFIFPYKPDLSCNTDSDCVVAIRLGQCCSCPQVYSKKDVDRDPRLVVYEYGRDYPSPPFCGTILCEPCRLVLGAICSNNMCQEPSRWEEFLRICPGIKEDYLKNSCYVSAALNAYEEVGLDKALELCNIEYFNKSSIFNPHIEEREFCLAEIGRKILDKDPGMAVQFCFDNLDKLQSRCLKEAGKTIAKTDINEGIKVCNKIFIKDTPDQFQKDACYHNIAVIARKTNETKALEICGMMSTKVEDCKNLIINYCKIYPC